MFLDVVGAPENPIPFVSCRHLFDLEMINQCRILNYRIMIEYFG